MFSDLKVGKSVPGQVENNENDRQSILQENCCLEKEIKLTNPPFPTKIRQGMISAGFW